jgi:hypothetical protein
MVPKIFGKSYKEWFESSMGITVPCQSSVTAKKFRHPFVGYEIRVLTDRSGLEVYTANLILAVSNGRCELHGWQTVRVSKS